MSVVNVSYFRKLPPTARELGIARRSAPKKEGQLRHAFLEKFWDSSRGWQDLGECLLVVTNTAGC